jgi:hypothetical protein
MKRQCVNFISAVLAVTLLTACGARDKGPAETALKAAEEAINTAKSEASRYLPDQTKSLETALASVKEKFSRGDYQAVLAEAPGLTSNAQQLASAAALKKEELTKSWVGLSSGMPRVVEVIRTRVDTLSQSKKLPAGMSADTLAQAKAGLGEITQQWTAATTASKGGDLMDAVSKANSAKVKAAEVLTLLKMPVPEALRG